MADENDRQKADAANLEAAKINLEISKMKGLAAGGCALMAMPFLLLMVALSGLVLWLIVTAAF